VFDDIITLAEAGALLGLAPVTLRAQATRGVLRARRIGKTWVTTREEVERYRREHLGKRGRSDREATKTDMSAVGDDGQVFGG
jgi:hypothetical protein